MPLRRIDTGLFLAFHVFAAAGLTGCKGSAANGGSGNAVQPNSCDPIAEGSVTSVDLAPGAVTSSALAIDSVNSQNIVDGGVHAEDLAMGAVNAASIDWGAGAGQVGAGLIPYRLSGGATVATTVGEKLGEVVSVTDFGAVGDGVADDTATLQAALDAQRTVMLPPGIYRTTRELVFQRGSHLIGSGNWSAVASNDIDIGTSVIRYAGAGGADSCVIRLSSAPVGVDPSSAPSTANLQNVSLVNVTIDGGRLAEIGLYMVRAWSNNRLDYITVTNTLKHGFLAMQCWNGSPTNWMAYKNLGDGITLGKNLYGWTNAQGEPNSNVDESTCTSFFAYYSGHDFQTVSQNTFNETTNPEDSYGIGVFNSRALVFVNAQAAQCGGAGIYLHNPFYPTKFVGGYLEGNGNASGASKQWAIWMDGLASSRMVDFDGTHLGLVPAIRLTGTAPNYSEAGVLFERMAHLNTIVADWDNYRVVDSDRSVQYANVRPSGFVQSLNGALNLSIAGTAVFDASSGDVSLLDVEGLIAGVTYISTGVYEVTLAQTFSSPRYAVVPSGGDNRIVGSGTFTGSSFRIYNRTTAGALTDTNSRISVLVTSYFN